MSTLKIQTPRWALPLLDGENGNPRYRGAKGGRSSGKSHFFAEAVVEKLIVDPSARVVCVREVQKSLKFSAKQLIVDKINSLEVTQFFDVQQTEIKRIGGSGVIIFQGLQDHTAESVKSLEGFDVAWIEEAQSISAFSLDLLDPTIRKDGSEIWASWNPRQESDPIEQLFRSKDNSVLVHVDYRQNPFNPPVVYEMANEVRSKDPLKYKHIWLGEYMSKVEGALWSMEMIDATRIADRPELDRIVVAIDPAVTSSETSDETGIIVAGKFGKQYYVLEDCSMRGSPDAWINKAVSKFHEWKADRIVAETNQGGDMIQSLLQRSDNRVPFRAVRATRGKILRAEPISAMYEAGKVSHVGRFRELEEQMIFYNGRGNVSPDRLDALVWALTELSSAGQAVWRIS